MLLSRLSFKELNIGIDSIVFVDDNPTERELVKKSLPELTVPDFPSEPYLLPQFYNKILTDFFSVHRLTEEDLNKSTQYIDNFSRKKFENNLGKIFDDEQVSAILSKCLDQDAIESMSVLDFQELFTVEENSF